MIKEAPPILVIGSLSQSFRLDDLEHATQVQKLGKIDKSKFVDLDRFEFLADGMTFVIEHHDSSETNAILKENSNTTLFGEPASKDASSIGVALGEHLKSGKHIPAINKMLLQLAMAIGNAISASHIAWLPARQSTNFAYFSESVNSYLEGGPTPILIQIAIEKHENGLFQTWGLSYFAEQEISLSAPSSMSDGDAIKRLVRIGHDIAVNGRVDNRLDANGLEKGERISYRPSPDLKELAVKIAFA